MIIVEESLENLKILKKQTAVNTPKIAVNA